MVPRKKIDLTNQGEAYEFMGLSRDMVLHLASFMNIHAVMALSQTAKLPYFWLHDKVILHGLRGLKIDTILSSSNQTIFMNQHGMVWSCWENSNGQLDYTPLFHKKNIKQIAVNSKSLGVFALDEQGKVWVYGGLNTFGQLGTGTQHTPPAEFSQPIQNIPFIQAIFAGESNSFFLDNEDYVWACGANENGKSGLGRDIGTKVTRPTKISAVGGIKKVVAGKENTFFLTKTGNVWGVGTNTYGQLGLGHTNPITTPEQITTLSNIIDITLKHDYVAFFLDQYEDVWACGTGAPSPGIVPTLKHIKRIIYLAGDEFFINGKHQVFTNKVSALSSVIQNHADLNTLLPLPAIKNICATDKTIYFFDFEHTVLTEDFAQIKPFTYIAPPTLQDVDFLKTTTHQHTLLLNKYGSVSLQDDQGDIVHAFHLTLKHQVALLNQLGESTIELACSKLEENKCVYDALISVLQTHLSNEALRLPILIALQKSKWAMPEILSQLLFKPNLFNEKSNLDVTILNELNQTSILNISTAFSNIYAYLVKHVKHCENERNDFIELLLKIDKGVIDSAHALAEHLVNTERQFTKISLRFFSCRLPNLPDPYQEYNQLRQHLFANVKSDITQFACLKECAQFFLKAAMQSDMEDGFVIAIKEANSGKRHGYGK
ncbi:MAG: hypothetical protein A3F14_02870 [Gammaproteobacteria bacterium RIFCSPHIGHO2_12_FULL_43_28]|nr:MAG: hypothetical protein A3F14_02870 [Gammaproteobacteria bacterium RIFCSPHIGHO2_12_FULL_43_28]